MDELVKRLRSSAEGLRSCDECNGECYGGLCIFVEAADAIEELMKAAKAMHTWIFLNTGDEQKVYDECGLSNEMNVALGYGGQFVAEPPKEE